MKTNFRSRKAQTQGAAAIIGIIALVLVLYVTLIPSEVGPGVSTSTGVSVQPTISKNMDASKTEFSFPGPGLVDDTEEGREILLSSINLKTNTQAKIFATNNAFYVTNSFFGDSKNTLIPFMVKNLENVDELYLSFLVRKSKGILKIKLNDFPLYENEISGLNIEPIRISPSLLKVNNILEVSVNDPGLIFWRTNEYIVDDFKVYGDVTDISSQSSLTSFELKSSEYKFLNRAKFKFYPDCDLRDVDRLYVSVNGREIYSQLPDCGVLNILDLPLITLKEGINEIEFRTTYDSYLIDRVSVETELKENDDLVYYFDLDKDLFVVKEEENAVCGEFDGGCPEGCSADNDQDCCFVEYTESYWCDVPTMNENDRCVGRVDEFNIDRCESGYEDRNGRAPDDFEGICGDDTDGECPIGCSQYYDKDCCFETSGNFWCDDVPTNGFPGICVGTVTQDSCSFCPNGYEGEDYDPVCSDGYDSKNAFEDESALQSDYKVELNLRFVDDNNKKRGVVKVNGYEIGFNTYNDEVDKDLSRFVRDGNNYVQVLPDNDFRLVNVEIKVLDR